MSKSNVDLSKIERLYSDNIRKFGNKAESVGWGTKEKQDLRFKKLLQLIERKEEPVTINELGCGYGELVKYCEREGFHLGRYEGYDISEDMLRAAKNYLEGYQVSFHRSDVIHTKANYRIASGIFNVMFNQDQSAWEGHIKNTLLNMFEMADKGIAFNLLTSYVDYEAKDLYYADPTYYFDFCKRRLGGKVNLIHDYQLYEWTIAVKKT